MPSTEIKALLGEIDGTVSLTPKTETVEAQTRIQITGSFLDDQQLFLLV